MKITVFNFILFQLGWFACVITGASGQPWLGVVIAMAIIAWHLRTARQADREVVLIIAAMLIGLIWDSLLVWQGWLQYTSGMFMPTLAPYWIVVMWALFATTLNVSLRWLRSRPVVAILFGAIGGPLAYLGGAGLGAVTLVEQLPALLALVLGWGVLTPLLMRLAQRYDGFAGVRAV